MFLSINDLPKRHFVIFTGIFIFNVTVVDDFVAWNRNVFCVVYDNFQFNFFCLVSRFIR